MSGLVRLEDRSVIEVSRADAQEFLQGILTNDIEHVEDGQAIYTGLLTPQGKLLFDFFVVKSQDIYLIDVDNSLVEELIKRLMFYKLRADVEIALLCRAVVCASWSEDTVKNQHSIHYTDPRLASMGTRILMIEGAGDDCKPNADAWLAHRITHGIPEAGPDFKHGDCFPHDIAMDQLNGIGFKKGCYVGQEVVSRMQHRGTARKRPMIVTSGEDLPQAPATIKADGKVMGQLGSVSGVRGLAEIRLDRAAKALREGKAFVIGETQITLKRPSWATYGEDFETSR